MAAYKAVDPRGYLLNDNNTGVDHLGESAFAEAIAESLHHVETPITIGLYGRWGSGKSFLLRHIENILRRFQRQQEISDKKKKGKMELEFRSKHVLRAVCWGGVIILLFLTLLVTVLLAVKPWLITECLGMKLPDPEKAQKSNGTGSATAVNPEEENRIILKRLRIAGLVLVPIELVLVFFVGCFGNRWMSPGYYGRCSLLTYGTFTKLLVRNSNKNIVEYPGQSPAKRLQHIKPGVKGLALAVSEAHIFPRKYILVDFKAWEYAGSDTLWAAIITKITDAVEQEFGLITARLFRILKIEEIESSICRENARTIYLELPNRSEEEVMEMMCEYGAVKRCTRPTNSVWQIEFCSDGECCSAKECLKIEGVDYWTSNPLESGKRRTENGDNQRGGPTERTNGADQPTNLGQLSSPARGRCCTRFCCHFLKYPTKILCLPRLVWWILIMLCAIVTPVIAYALAEHFGLDIYRTYREVPLYGQILLWLPAGAAVTSVTTKFIWAMCHSQRKRINAALDGTKHKMVDQLGFMSKVKNEIEVVSKLIQCARFTHQKDYKIVITIDDLDRIPLKQVQSVLEAINILLSDISAPFICLVAVDSRIAVKCIEESMGDVLKESHITGHEYLKKIINLSICLPEISDVNKKRFIAGLIDQADRSVNYRKKGGKTNGCMDCVNEVARPGSSNSRAETGLVDIDGGRETIPKELCDEDCPDGFYDTVARPGGSNSRAETGLVDVDGGRETIPKKLYDEDSHDGFDNTRLRSIPKEYADRYCETSFIPDERSIKPQHEELDHKSFLFQCRNYMYEFEEFHKHIHGNARNIKRLFNIISLTACLINSFKRRRRRRHIIQPRSITPNCTNLIHRTAELAKNLVMWVILTDQWPYRSSYILQVIEDAEQRCNAGLHSEEIPKNWTILEIYENKVKQECLKGEDWLHSLDGDPDLFFSYLQLMKKCRFTTSKIQKLQNYTVNLDFSIRHAIAFERGKTILAANQGRRQAPRSIATMTDETDDSTDDEESEKASEGQKNASI